MTQRFQRFTKRYVNVIGVLIGLTVVSSILFYSGCGMTSSPNIRTNPTPTPDTTPPTSTITFPTSGATLLTRVGTTISGTASDTGGGTVARVEVSVDGGATFSAATVFLEDGRPPGTVSWRFSWTPATPGPVTIRSRAVDSSLNVQNPPAQITVTVIQDSTPPTSTITSPTEGAIVKPGDQFISGTASDAGGGTVARVEVSVDGGANYSDAVGTDNWSFKWRPHPSQAGPVTIKSRAVDNSGNVQDPPAEIHVTIDAPPTSKITSPTEGAIVVVGIPVDITGTASDPGGGLVFKVEVSVDGGANYSRAMGLNAWSFKWTPGAPGPATIKSRAVDDIGNVQNPPAEITVTVRPPIKVPSDQSTIQSAIDVATNGDTVLVAPGTYPEHIDFKGKAITVTSESGPEVTTIDGRNVDSVVIFTSGEGRGSIINGFTLQNGSADPNRSFEGGGVSIQNSSPTITNNVIRNNKACFGGGIGMGLSSPLIKRNTITGNSNIGVCSVGNGGGISIRGEASSVPVEILDNEISDNGLINTASGGGIYMIGAETPIIKRNIIKGNNAVGGQGGGIYIINASDALIVQNLITGNQAFVGGGIYWLVGGPILVNNTIADNNGTNGSGIFADGNDGRTELTNNIIVAKPGQTGLDCRNFDGHSGSIIRSNNIFSSGGMAYDGDCSDKTGMDGNIKADPLFTNPAQADYHLQQGSPSIDAGDNQATNLPDTDIDGDPRILDGDGNGTEIVDMGVDEFLALPVLKISLLGESNGNSTNGRYPFICDLRPWTRTLSRPPKNRLSALSPRSPRLRVE